MSVYIYLSNSTYAYTFTRFHPVSETRRPGLHMKQDKPRGLHVLYIVGGPVVSQADSELFTVPGRQDRKKP